MTNIAIILSSENNFELAQKINENITGSTIYTKAYIDNTIHITSTEHCIKEIYSKVDAFIVIDAMGSCIRAFAAYISTEKANNPALICVDNNGKYAISILLGRDETGNLLTKRVAHIIGAESIITTRSESENLWSLETIGERFRWEVDTNSASFNYPQTSFLNKRSTALLLDVQDEGTAFLERTVPEHVNIYYKYDDIEFKNYELLIAVTPYKYPDLGIQIIYYHPQVLHIGISCKDNIDENQSFPESLSNEITGQNISLASIKSISSVDFEDNTKLLKDFENYFKNIPVYLFTQSELGDIKNLDALVEDSQGTHSVGNMAEAVALKSSGNGQIVLERQKAIMSRSIVDDFTYAIALDSKAIRQGHVEIIGAGPGDPELISIKARNYIEVADLILYSEKLVDVAVTYGAKDGVVVRNLDSLSLKEQFNLINEYYERGKLIVRLNSGDPAIYGALQEYLRFFDEHQMSYHITPGIPTFSAAAAALESQLTISNYSESVILTRDTTDKSLPDRQKIEALAKSQSTMCILLHASDSQRVQDSLLKYYSPDTPIAVCYRITWKDEQIYRGELNQLAQIVTENKLLVNTLIMVGKSIGNRVGLSKLYAERFKYLTEKRNEK